MGIKLSIITVCKNEPFIQSTCESVINQTNRSFEWIVVDGASTDEETLKTLSLYQSNMTHFISEPDSGIYEAMNTGIRLAMGEFVLFLNGGDYLYNEQVIQNVLAQLDESADVFYGDSYRLFDGDDRSQDMIKTYPDVLQKTFFLTNTLAHQSSFIRRSLFDTYGLYREDFKIVSEKEKWLVFIENGVRFKHLPSVISVFRLNGISQQKTPALALEKQRMFAEHFADPA